MPTRALISSLLAVATVLSFALSARAAEITRTSYREAVEPICKTDTQANERILDGVKNEVRGGQLKPAAARFTKAARALTAAIAELRAVPPPPADTARLRKWLGKVSVEAVLFERVARKLAAGDKAGAQKLVVKLSTEANAANNVVIPFQFAYCRLEPSRFT
jgi:hypothetical protein